MGLGPAALDVLIKRVRRLGERTPRMPDNLIASADVRSTRWAPRTAIGKIAELQRDYKADLAQPDPEDRVALGAVLGANEVAP
jgi:hypothetical protein